MIALTSILALLIPLQDQNSAQDEQGGAKTPSQQDLAAWVTDTHRPAGGSDDIDRFHAKIRTLSLGDRPDGNIDITLDATYARSIELKPGGLKMAMIRYTIEEGRDPQDGKRYERGIDAGGAWMLKDDRSQRLTSREYQTDRELIDSHRKLCDQMLTLLDPSSIVSALTNTDPITTVEIVSGGIKPEKIPTYKLRGNHPSFPMFRGDNELVQGRALVTVWVHRDTHALRAVEVFSFDQTGHPSAQGEYIDMSKHVLHDGILLPRILMYRRIDGATRQSEWQIELKTFTANPTLTRASFAMPSKRPKPM